MLFKQGLSFLFLSLSIGFTLADDDNTPEKTTESDVTTLTPDNIDSFLAENDIAVLEFYAPWCGHCKAFAPEYEIIATSFKENHQIPVAKADCDAHSDIGQRFDVSGYPTIKIWKSGQAYDYKGARSLAAIEEKVLEMKDPEWAPPKPAVLELTTENFEETIKNDFVLVMFFAPWCGHCKAMKPDFEDVAQYFKSKAESAEEGEIIPIIASLDATVEGTIAQKYEVTGYPTLKVFRQGSVSDYKGGRKADELIEEISKYLLPASKPFSTINEAKRRVLETRGNSNLVFCIDENDKEMTEKMDKIANEFRVDWLDVNHVSDEATQNAINCKPGDFFMVHNEMFRSKFEEDRIKIESADDVKNNKKPLVGQSYKNNDLAVYGDEDKPMVRIFGHFDFTPKYRKASQIIRKKVLNVAKKYKNDFYFVLMDEDEHKDYMKACHLDDTAEDVNICITQGKKKIYPLLEPEDDFSEDLLLDFVKKFKDGKIKPYLKSAKAPKNNNGPVKIVVSNEFDKIVMEKGKEVLIEFYAPWCGHCKQLEPIYKKLGKFYEKEDSLIIAKMDLTANDIPNEAFPEVTGFPTIFYVDKENNIEKYESGRDLASFKAFIDGKGAGEELRDEL